MGRFPAARVSSLALELRLSVTLEILLATRFRAVAYKGAQRPDRMGSAMKPTVPEAPRPADDQIDGRSPGFAGLDLAAFPGLAQWRWLGRGGRILRLAAYSCGGSRGFGDDPYRVPCLLETSDRQ
ncbi:MAG: hypothetical protein A49_24040 [Methyloceanibacter sp.]|nr:MAG: hypothetical protein A49_24040 [Methyloceanibacter sp.]